MITNTLTKPSLAKVGAFILAIFFFFLGNPAGTYGAEGDENVEKIQEQTEAASRVLGDRRFFVMPIPIVNPTIGTGLGASAMYLFQAGENAPPSSLLLGGFYTDSESWAAGVGTQTHFQDDRYRLAGWFGYFDVNVEFFGIGNEAGERGISIPINQRGPFLVPSFMFRIADNLYLGGQYRFLTVNTSIDKGNLPPILAEILPDVFRIVSSGLGILLNYDTRDNRFYPFHGSFLDVNTNFASEIVGSDRNYQQYRVGHNLYRSIAGEMVIAWRATGCFGGGDTPFYDLCNFGGEFDSMRGYIGGQYRDDISVTTQVEYRWRFYKKWGMVAFAGIGEVATGLSGLNGDDILPSIGLGIRYRASEKERVNLGVDYAAGKGSDAWYFRIGEAF